MNSLQKATYVLAHPLLPIRYWRLRSQLGQLRNERKSLWLFQCDFKGHFSYLSPYWKEAAKLDDVEVFFFVGNDGQGSTTGYLLEQGVDPARIVSHYDLVRLTDWDLYASPTEWGNVFPRNESATRVQLFHTLADKGLEYGGELTKFDVVVASGPIHHEFLEKYVFSRYPGSRERMTVMDIGYAKIDSLFDGTYSRSEVRQNLGITSDDVRPLVLYAPNWEDDSALGTYGESVFEAMVACPDILFVVKLHYMSLVRPRPRVIRSDVDWNMVLQRYAQYENIKVAFDQDINPYLVAADAMITDYGGASLEYLAMNRPIVYLDCPGFFDERGHDVFEKEARRTGHIIDSTDRLIDTVRDALEDDPAIQKVRAEFAAMMLYNPGRAAHIGCRRFREHVKMREASVPGARQVR